MDIVQDELAIAKAGLIEKGIDPNSNGYREAVIELWIQALRSGKYQQTDSQLRRGNGFCCLGVLCDVVNPNAWTETDSAADGTYYWGEKFAFAGKGEEYELPDEIIQLLGFHAGTGDFAQEYSDDALKDAEGCSIYSLAGLNDVLKYSFNDIADFIEANKSKIFI